MIVRGTCVAVLCAGLGAAGCGTFSLPGGGDKDETPVEIRQVPGQAEYTIFGPHRLRAVLTITGLPEGASEEDEAAARQGTYSGPVVWTIQGVFTFGTDAHKALTPEITVGKSKPEHVEILLKVVPPPEEVARITITRVPITASFTASPQTKFQVRVVESKQ